MPIEIFKTGTHVSEDGTEWSFPEDVVRQIVTNYDPAVFAAPLVVGHPTLDAPSYGEAATLRMEGDKVVMEPQHVEPQFAALVNQRRFPKVSASLFPPEHPANPRPGEWYLRHVGFLGGAAPAIPGLKPASFSGDASGIVTIQFAAQAAAPIPQPIPQEVTVDPKEEEQKKQQTQQTADFAAQQAELDKKAAAIAAREKALADQEAAARKADVASFAAKLVDEGKLLPREQPMVEALLGALPAEQEVSFAAPEGGEIKKPSGIALREFLTGLPKRVDYQEHTAANADDAQAKTASFAAPTGYTVDASRMELHNQIVAYQKQHNVDYTTAAAAVGG